MLIQGPKSDKLETTIPEGTKVNNVELKGDVVYVDLSAEFINNHKGGSQQESKTVYSIVNTLTELNEVNSVRILIDGEENKCFTDNQMNFKGNFVRAD